MWCLGYILSEEKFLNLMFDNDVNSLEVDDFDDITYYEIEKDNNIYKFEKFGTNYIAYYNSGNKGSNYVNLDKTKTLGVFVGNDSPFMLYF